MKLLRKLGKAITTIKEAYRETPNWKELLRRVALLKL
jgi:hypothetical protein